MVEEESRQQEQHAEGSSYYRTQFEKLQRLKAGLEENYQLDHYQEDRDYFYAKNHRVKRRRYVERGRRVRELRDRRRALYDRYVTLRGLYLRSRAGTAYDEELRANFEEVRRVNAELSAVLAMHEERPDGVFDRVDGGEDDDNAVETDRPRAEDEKGEEGKEEQKKRRSRSKSPSKAHRVKSFLFKTYAKCAEAKRSDPEYMTKDAIIAHIKEHYPEMLQQLPKNLKKMKREDICKVIFK